MLETVGDTDLDECLTSDPEAARLAIDLLQHWQRSVDPLDISPRAANVAKIQMRGQVVARIVLRDAGPIWILFAEHFPSLRDFIPR